MTIGFAPPLPQLRNLDHYVSVVEAVSRVKLSANEIVWAAEARAGGISAFQFAEWIKITDRRSQDRPND